MNHTLSVSDEAWAAVADDAAEVGIDRDELSDHLRSVAGEHLPLPVPRVRDLVLALGCVRGHPRAIRRFEDEMVPAARRAIERLQRDAQFVDEALQRLRTRLLVAQHPDVPRIITYAGRAPLGRWVTASAVRMAMSVLRELGRSSPLTDQRWAAVLAQPHTGDEELEYLKRYYRPRFEEALIEAAASLSERPRAMLKLAFAHNMSIDRIANLYGIHRATAARWIIKAKDDLLHATHDILQRDEGIPATELLSLQRLLRSQLEASVIGLFGTTESKEVG